LAIGKQEAEKSRKNEEGLSSPNPKKIEGVRFFDNISENFLKIRNLFFLFTKSYFENSFLSIMAVFSPFEKFCKLKRALNT